MNRVDKLNLNDLASDIFAGNVEKGWWDNPRSFAECVALMHSELSEALEVDRKPTKAELRGAAFDLLQEQDDEIFKMQFEDLVKDTKGDELADTIIRILDWCGFEHIDIQSHILAKLRYNKMRSHKHGGKKY